MKVFSSIQMLALPSMDGWSNAQVSKVLDSESKVGLNFQGWRLDYVKFHIKDISRAHSNLNLARFPKLNQTFEHSKTGIRR